MLVEELCVPLAATVGRGCPPPHVSGSERRDDRLRDRPERLTCRLARKPPVLVVWFLPVPGEVDGSLQASQQGAAVEWGIGQVGDSHALAERFGGADRISHPYEVERFRPGSRNSPATRCQPVIEQVGAQRPAARTSQQRISVQPGLVPKRQFS